MSWLKIYTWVFSSINNHLRIRHLNRSFTKWELKISSFLFNQPQIFPFYSTYSKFNHPVISEIHYVTPVETNIVCPSTKCSCQSYQRRKQNMNIYVYISNQKLAPLCSPKQNMNKPTIFLKYSKTSAVIGKQKTCKLIQLNPKWMQQIKRSSWSTEMQGRTEILTQCGASYPVERESDRWCERTTESRSYASPPLPSRSISSPPPPLMKKNRNSNK